MKKILLAMVSVLFASQASAEISVKDAKLLIKSQNAASAAAFMVIENTYGSDAQLISVSSQIAAKTELHTHSMDASGVMRMTAVEGGLTIPAAGSHALKRGGDHVMLMGLTNSLKEGDVVELNLEFRKTGQMTISVPVTLNLR